MDIEDPAFTEDGTSKGSRLRCFLRKVQDPVAAKLLRALRAHRDTYLHDCGDPDPVANSSEKFDRLLSKLGGATAAPPRDPLVPPPKEEIAAELRTALYEVRDLEPHARGYAFEKFLTRCFALSGLQPRTPFRNVGEQIDGSFQYGNDTYLVEAKWVLEPIGNRDLHAFHGKLDSKATWTRGVFVSYGGFTPEGLESFGKGKRVICMEGRDLWDMLERSISLTDVLERKVRHASETGFPFATVADLFGAA